jgi:hypothetical protein
MTPRSDARFVSVGPDHGETRYCPECGQPLTLAPTGVVQRRVVSWRSIFLGLIGLYFVITARTRAGPAEPPSLSTAICVVATVGVDCTSVPLSLARQIVLSSTAGGGAAVARALNRDLGGNLRLTVIGLAGVAVGLAAGLFRFKRPRRLAFGVDLLVAAEGLLTVFYLQLLGLSGYLFVTDQSSGTPLVLDRFGDSVVRAVYSVLTLVGAQ